MEEFDIGTEGKYNKRGGLNKERGVSQKAEINKRPPPVYSAPKSIKYLIDLEKVLIRMNGAWGEIES